MNTKLERLYPSVYVARYDIQHQLGLTEEQAFNITNAQMREIAEKLQDAYVDGDYWQDLGIIAGDIINVEELKKNNKESDKTSVD